jgi:hypothetical protein
VSQNITSVFKKFSGVVFVVSVVELTSFLVFEHPLIQSKDDRINIPADEMIYALNFIAALISIFQIKPGFLVSDSDSIEIP